jgi:histidyl-tRNA synthetase
MVEQRVLDGLRERFELYGFAPVETRSVETLDTLLAKGETDKEIYVLRRLAEEGPGDAGIGLHYDLTVPFARYAVQHYNELSFPFKRYQIQRAWRGERPQEGRYREFLQADIDVIDRGSLALHFDAEMPALVHETLASLPFPPVTLRVNNRKVTEGFMRGLGVEDPVPAMRVLDKADKVPVDALREMLAALGVTDRQTDSLLALASVSSPSVAIVGEVLGLGVTHELLDEGLEELRYVMDELSVLPTGAVVADMGVVRGFDYYTGTVYEGVMRGHESLGAVCSGGRYDNLASGARETLPGVGISIGVSRILGRLFGQGLLVGERKTPTVVLVALPAADDRPVVGTVVRALRARGIPTEAYHEPARLKKQLRYADDKGIRYVWLPFADGPVVRDLATGDQVSADVDVWSPDAAALSALAAAAAEEADS